jgi:tetratricopeptide (TPR) repeat protein
MHSTGNFMFRTLSFLLLASAFVAFLCNTGFSQEVIMASNTSSEPLGLYKKVNESLTLGNTRSAMNTFKKVIEFYEEEGRLKELPQNYLGMALSLAFNGNYKESIRFHKKALRAHRKYRAGESNADILMNLGLAYELAGKMKKSKRVLEKV